METTEQHTLTLQLDDRCRALARVLTLIEGRNLEVGEVRFSPAGAMGRIHAEAVIQVRGPVGRLQTVVTRIEMLPNVRRALVDRPVALLP